MVGMAVAIGALAQGASGLMQADTVARGQREQKRMIEEEQAIQKGEIEEQKSKALEERKTMIDRKRRSLFGAKRTIGQTNNIGQPAVTPSTQIMDGEVLG